MTNPLRGEVSLIMNGRAHSLRLSLGALVAFENARSKSVFALLQDMEKGDLMASDLKTLLFEALKAGGYEGDQADLETATFADGYLGTVRAVSKALRYAFNPLEHADDD